jgi:hypothetical protein
MASKYPTFNLARYAAEILAEHRATAGPRVSLPSSSEVAKRDLERGYFKPTIMSLKPTGAQLRQVELARAFQTPVCTKVFPKVRYLEPHIVMLQHADGSIYRINLRLDGFSYDIERDGWAIELKRTAWVPGMCPLAWLLIHAA